MEDGQLGTVGHLPAVHAHAGGCPENGACGLIILLRVALPHFILNAPKVGTMILALCGSTQNADCLEGWGQGYSYQPVRGSA